jgi:hypothetical protein
LRHRRFSNVHGITSSVGRDLACAFSMMVTGVHPHVRMVVKAVSEQGVRLNIRKATLRGWRKEFARHLRAQGMEANATERAVRGNRLPAKLDRIYRAEQRSGAHHFRRRAEAVARELLKGDLRIDQSKARLLETQRRSNGDGSGRKMRMRFSTSLQE